MDLAELATITCKVPKEKPMTARRSWELPMGISFPDRGPLRSSDFSGGENTVKALLEQLGFTVTGPESPPRVRGV